MHTEEKCHVQVLSAGARMEPGFLWPAQCICIAVLDQQPSRDVSPAWESHWQRFHSSGRTFVLLPKK